MAKTAGNALLSPALERDLRQLQFADPELERCYRHVYAESARIHLRVVLAVTLVIPVAGFIANVLGASGREGGSGIWVLTIHLCALLLTWSPWFSRLFQGMLALLCAVAALSVIINLLPAPEASHPLLVAAIYTYTLFRLRFRLAVGVYWTVTAVFLALSLGRYHVPTNAVLAALPGLVIAPDGDDGCVHPGAMVPP